MSSDYFEPSQEDLSQADLKSLFEYADQIGQKRYHRLTQEDFDNYRQFDYWRYIGGDYECGTTQESRLWVDDHSEKHCPICGHLFSRRGGKTIDHKLPRSQYPWLSMEFKNLWVICRDCNQEKGENHWYEYERFILEKYPDRYLDVKFARPSQLLKTLETEKSSEL
jgi:5-methylcytosine-specific restriction endonuclease McrA